MIFYEDDGPNGYTDIFDYIRYSETLERLMRNIDYYVWCQNLDDLVGDEDCEDYVNAKKQIPKDVEEIIEDLEYFELGALEGDKYLTYDNYPIIDIYNNKFSFNYPGTKEDEIVKECREIVSRWHDNPEEA